MIYESPPIKIRPGYFKMSLFLTYQNNVKSNFYNDKVKFLKINDRHIA